MSGRLHVYVAGPLHTPAERGYLERLDSLCQECGLISYLPHRDGGLAPADGSSTQPFFDNDIAALEQCDLVVAVLNGADVDSGTAWELGYAFAREKWLLGIYEDMRVSDVDASFNLMVTCSTRIVGSFEELRAELVTWLKRRQPTRDKDADAVAESDVQKVISAVGEEGLDLTAATPETFGYSNTALCCIDAVLSINRPYRRFVVPRLEHFKARYSHVTSLRDLLSLIDDLGDADFAAEAWNYNDLRRVRVLRRLTERMMTVVGSATETEEREKLKTWLSDMGVDGAKQLGVKGIGLATYQYLRMLLGISTVKPDIHITRFIEGVLGRKVSAVTAIRIIEAAADSLGIEATTLDHAIWLSRAENAEGKSSTQKSVS